MTEQTQYESFEIELCQRTRDPYDGDYIEVVADWQALTPAAVEALQVNEGGEVFWTVYGRKPDGEVDAIADSQDRERADHIMDLLIAGNTVHRVPLDQPCHYYVGTHLNWATDADLGKALDKARRAHKADSRKRMFKQPMMAQVWLVPLAADAHYEINFYVPQVEGAQLIANMAI